MTVTELIERLRGLDGDLRVEVWVDHDGREATDVEVETRSGEGTVVVIV